jgi:hypothetical protein
LNDKVVRESLALWRQRLAATPAQPGLATGANSVGAAGIFDPFRLTLPRELVRDLEEVCRKSRTSIVSALLLAYAAAAARFTRQEKTLIDTFLTSPSRLDSAIAPLIGCLADIRPVLVDLTGESSFPDFAKRVDDTLMFASGEAAPGVILRDTPGVPRAQLAFNYRGNVPPRSSHRLPGVRTQFHRGPSALFSPLALPELALHMAPIPDSRTKGILIEDHQVFLGINDLDGELTCIFWFAEKLRFDAPTASQLVSAFRQNVEAIVARPASAWSTWGSPKQHA